MIEKILIIFLLFFILGPISLLKIYLKDKEKKKTKRSAKKGEELKQKKELKKWE